MTRQQKRKQTREAEKELSRIHKDKVFIGLMRNKEWEALPDGEIKMLLDGTHANKRLSRNYVLAMAYMKAIVTLETRIELLKNK